MTSTHRIGSWLAIAGGTIAATVGVFALLLRMMRPGWESSEYGRLVFWTTPLALGLVALAGPVRRALGRFPVLVRIVAATALAPILAYAWLWVVYAATGGYVMALAANPLWCWTIGVLVGLLVVVLRPLPGGSPVRAEAA